MVADKPEEKDAGPAECLLEEWVVWAVWAAWVCNHSYSKQNSKRAVFTALFFLPD